MNEVFMGEEMIANRKFKQASISALISVMVFSFVAHGFMFFNKLSFHDDIGQLFHLGGTFVFGRWLLGVLGKIWSVLFGNISVPWWNGLISTVWIALTAAFSVRILKINSKKRALLLGTLFAVFPVVTSTYAFMFTAPYYFFALFLGVLAVFLQERGWVGLGAGICCLVASLGIYQAYLAVVLTLLLILWFLKGMQQKSSWNYMLKISFRYLVFVSFSMLGYALMNELFLWYLKMEMSTYQGFNGLYRWNINMVGRQFIETYLDFFRTGYNGIHPTKWMQATVWVSIVVDMLLTGYLLYTKKLNKRLKSINIVTACITLTLFPFVVNSIYLISEHENTYIHHVMRYSLVMIWVLPIVLMEQCERTGQKNRQEASKNILLRKAVRRINEFMTLIIMIQVISYCYLDNSAYLKAYFIQEQATNYFTVLENSIRQTPGYRDEYPVAFLQDRQKVEVSMTDMKEFDIVQLIGYDTNLLEMVNDYNWEIYMARYCGYQPLKAEKIEDIAEWPEVVEMPCYPDDGSVAVCKGIVVVKFAEEPFVK